MYNWLDRFKERDFEDALYDDERPGRPPELSDEQFQQFAETLNQSPEEAGYDEPAWSSTLSQQHLITEFDVAHSRRHVQRLMKEAEVSYVSASRDGINFLGGLTENGETMFLECAGSFNKETTVRFFQSLQARFGEKLLVVLDKGSYFTAKKVKEFADKSKLELLYLPTGMAKLNPTEECWRQLRSALGNQYFGEVEELRSEIRSKMNEINPPGVYQYFCR